MDAYVLHTEPFEHDPSIMHTYAATPSGAPDMAKALERMRKILRDLQPALNAMARDVLDDIISFEIEPALAKIGAKP